MTIAMDDTDDAASTTSGTLEDRKALLFAQARAKAAQEGPEEEEEEKKGKSDDELGVTEGSSRRSSARPRAQKGRACKEKNLQRMQRHVESLGGTWADTHLQRRMKALEVATGVKGSMAVEAQRKYKALVDEMGQMSVQEKSKFLHDAFEVPLRCTPVSAEAVERASRGACVDGRCIWCNKVFDEWHAKSTVHTQRAELAARLDVAVGEKTPRRLYDGYKPNPKCPYFSRRDLCDFWGGDTERLHFYGFSRLLASTGIQLRAGRRTIHVPREHIKGLVPAVVCYDPADSKYANARCVPWSEIPAELLEEGLPKDAREQWTDHTNQSWWPVCILEFQDPDMYPVPEWQIDSGVGVQISVEGGVWVVCIYQWMEILLWGWPIRMSRWV